jgi:acetyltransferase-like isoleucine patch superfamily enzyme
VSAPQQELRYSKAAPAIYGLYKLLKGQRRWTVASALFKVLRMLEGGMCHTGTVRQILARHHQVEVGAYSYGDCMIPGVFPPQVVVGRWVSIGPGVRVYNQNHPLDHISLHPYFYEPGMGVVKENPMPRHTLEIGHDSWLGRNATVLPGCKRIGIGAVIGAGAIVTKDVDDYAIVGGNPARLIRYRFPEEKRAALLASRWWERSIADIAKFAGEMARPVDEQLLNHPLLQTAVAEESIRQRPLVAVRT